MVTKRLLSVSDVRHAVNVALPTSTETCEPGRADRVATVDRLLDAGARAFADKGFHATTTRDIASRAGLSPAGVYVHFASKEALLHALSLTGHEAALDLVSRALTEPPTPTLRLTRLMSDFAAWHAEHHEVARVVQYEFPHLSPEHYVEVVALRRELDAKVQAVVEDGVAGGEFVIDDVRETVLALLSLCVDVARWYSPRGRLTASDIGSRYASLGLRLLGADRRVPGS